ncbi:Calpain-1 catalytic subunit [Liparis tanakae]|uniref:Calpain-1 catalytic subunit n=1 Tax=Liparis tanakae TaxID=230148 RepID=A0A4Z2HR83_9TELE|nr:Calpain-1 catalytic subunit [Liparis tanakae]
MHPTLRKVFCLKPLVNMPESGNCTSIINLRYQDGSEGSPSNPAKFNNQDYAQLKDNNLRRGRLFVDNTFPPNNQSLGDLEGLTRRQEAQFWRFGKWVDVVIDDFLPTLNNKPLSVRSKIGNEVCGSYADMSAGLPSEACKDFSGGLNMNFELHAAHKAGHDVALWNALTRATKCHSMICCGTPQKGGKLVNTVKETGIVDAHAYSVTGVTEVNYYNSIVKLVRLMNPWGQTEWNGKWSDNVHDHVDDDEHDHEEEENLILPEVPTDNGHAEDEVKEETNGRRATRALFNRYADQVRTSYGFGLDTCMSMMAMVDTDQKMTMTFKEFSTLWGKINKYKRSFHSADVNRGGTLSQYELQKAIEAAGKYGRGRHHGKADDGPVLRRVKHLHGELHHSDVTSGEDVSGPTSPCTTRLKLQEPQEKTTATKRCHVPNLDSSNTFL